MQANPLDWSPDQIKQINEFIDENFSKGKQKAGYPEVGIGRKLAFSFANKDAGWVIEFFSEFIVSDSPKDRLGYEIEDVQFFDGVSFLQSVIVDGEKTECIDGQVFPYVDFCDQYLSDCKMRVYLDTKLEEMKEMLEPSESYLGQITDVWNEREPGARSISIVEWM